MASQDKHNLYDITLTYLLTTASKLKQSSLKFQ